MSLITRCPACTTMFRVVPDQLRISDGWVRCGHCDEVFDANAHLHTEVEELPVASHDEAPVASVVNLDDSTVAPPTTEISLTDAPIEVTDEDEPVEDPFLEKSPQELSTYSSILDGDTSEVVPGMYAAHDLDADAATPPLRYVQSAQSVRLDADDKQLSFVRTPRASSVWQRPLVKAALLACCLLLGVVLVLQVVVQERDYIAATKPDTQPFLERVCGVLACKVSALRQIESVVIESSSFTKVYSDVYRLNFTLKNANTIHIATPALELTLTDMQDQSVIRRVFSPLDFGVKQGSVLPGADLTISMPISVKGTTGAERISGYRLIAFYP